MSMTNIENIIEDRVIQAIDVWNNNTPSDSGLEKIFDLVEIVLGRVKRNNKPADIYKALSQSGAGKGFHISTMFNHFLMTEEVIRMSWENESFPKDSDQKNGKISCWEHVIPWKQTITRVVEYIEENGKEKIEAEHLIRIFVEGSVKCFVSGKEDRRLEENKLGSSMCGKDVFCRYKKTNIFPIIIKFHDFNCINMKSLLDKLKKKSVSKTYEEYLNEISAAC